MLSLRTVERHISNIYQKIGATGKVAKGHQPPPMPSRHGLARHRLRVLTAKQNTCTGRLQNGWLHAWQLPFFCLYSAQGWFAGRRQPWQLLPATSAPAPGGPLSKAWRAEQQGSPTLTGPR